MGHPEIENLTPFAFEASLAVDEAGRLLYVPIVKATYSIRPHGELRIAPKQVPVNLAGELWGEAGKSSYKYEPEYAFVKVATDVVLIGHAHAGGTAATEIFVRLRAGPVDKTVRVVGDRYWIRTLGMVSATAPEPFETMPLLYERAFGGWDAGEFEKRNPVGTGFRSQKGRFEEGVRLPNLEDPNDPITRYGGMVMPAGLGFTAPDWIPRSVFAGTYDQKWQNERMPLLPHDFDRRFFSAASPGLVAPGYLKGNEPVCIENASRRGTLRFFLPDVPPPECRVQLSAGKPDVCLSTNLDTVIINTDEDLVMLLWRASLVLRNGSQDVASVQVRAEGVPVPALEE